MFKIQLDLVMKLLHKRMESGRMSGTHPSGFLRLFAGQNSAAPILYPDKKIVIKPWQIQVECSGSWKTPISGGEVYCLREIRMVRFGFYIGCWNFIE